MEIDPCGVSVVTVGKQQALLSDQWAEDTNWKLAVWEKVIQQQNPQLDGRSLFREEKEIRVLKTLLWNWQKIELENRKNTWPIALDLNCHQKEWKCIGGSKNKLWQH